MIFPTKYIAPEQSLIGLGAIILSKLKRPRTVTSLWNSVRTAPKDGVSFEHFVLSLDLLYALHAIELSDGLIKKTSS